LKGEKTVTDDMVVERGQGEDHAAELKAYVDAKLETIFAQRRSTAVAQLAGPVDYWNIWATGPYQDTGLEPGRIINVGERAYIPITVFLNPNWPEPPALDTCTNLTQHNDKIELTIVTSNMQTMQPVPALTKVVCIPTTPGICWYTSVWEFTPEEAACVYETNICARICNCTDQALPQFAAFVRWVYDYDFELLFGSQGWEFDHPIRYMVNDPTKDCECY
jgi:hypothetical protein